MIAEQTGQSDELKRELIKFVNAFGAAFQIQDDVISVTSEEYRKQRGSYAEDIQEGKRSLMVIHSFYYGWNGDRLVEILDMHTTDEKLLKEAVDILNSEESIKYAQDLAAKTMKDAWKSFEKFLPDCDAKEDLHSLSKFLVQRDL